MTTIQFDFNLPERFDMNFIGVDGQKHRPYMVHRALLGSLERFFGVMVEHYAGAFPIWLAPIQIMILTISDNQVPFAKEVLARLKGDGFRAELDDRSEKLGLKIRESQMQKVPYMLVVGAKEVENNSVAVRSRSKGDIGVMEIGKFIELAQKEITTKE
jgi:threonyl-tRNA synthetase